MFESYSELKVHVDVPCSTVELELLSDGQYDELVRTAKDPSKLLKALRSVELHSEHGAVVLLQRAVELFAERTGKQAPQPNEYSLTVGQNEILNNILPELFLIEL